MMRVPTVHPVTADPDTELFIFTISTKRFLGFITWHGTVTEMLADGTDHVVAWQRGISRDHSAAARWGDDALAEVLAIKAGSRP